MNHLDDISILRASDPSAVIPGTGRVAMEGLDGQIVGGPSDLQARLGYAYGAAMGASKRQGVLPAI
jgi:hypothetical protein